MQEISTITATTAETNSTLTSVKGQLKLEMSLGPNDRGITEDTKSLLLQKFGLVAPQLTDSEKNLIRREEGKNAKRAA
jgi:hypothetical protein